MRKTTKPISMILTLCILLTAIFAVTASVSAADADLAAVSRAYDAFFVVDDIRYKSTYYIDDDGQVSFSDEVEAVGYEGSDAELIIPSSVTFSSLDYTITKIGDITFDDPALIRSVVIPDTVTSIGNNAFSGCVNLLNIDVPASVTRIGFSAFEGTAWLESQPDGPVYINDIFYQYKGDYPEYLEIEEGTKYITGYSFYYCETIRQINIPGTVEGIGEAAFSDCHNLQSVDIPDSVINIEACAFVGCSSMSEVNIGDSVKYIGYKAFGDCESLTSVKLGKSVETIDGRAFYECPDLKSVTIPKSVKTIEELAFGYSYDFATWENVKIDGFTIYGYKDTAAQEYAEANGFEFVELQEAAAILGDADGSGEVDMADATIIQRVATMIAVPYDEDQLMCADVDGDGSLTIVDATFIQRYSTKVQTPYTIGEPIA